MLFALFGSFCNSLIFFTFFIFFTSEPVHGTVKISPLLSNILFTLNCLDTHKGKNNGFVFTCHLFFLLTYWIDATKHLKLF